MSTSSSTPSKRMHDAAKSPYGPRGFPGPGLNARAFLVLTWSVVMAAGPATAQHVVFDPSNHAENLIQAARQLEALTQQARLISQQARSLAASPHAPVADAARSMAAIDALSRSAQGLSAYIDALERQFETLYPEGLGELDAAMLARGRSDRLQTARSTAQDLARIAAGIDKDAPARSRRLEAALAASHAAEGQTAAIQSSTWTLASLAEELAALRAVVLAQARLQAEAAVSQTAESAAAAETRRRFWGRRAATPAAPRFDPLPNARDQE